VSNDFDVLIIGGGPSGSAAALQSRRAGLRAALIEREAFPRHRPGETLHPAVEPLLERLGAAGLLVSANFLRHEGNWVKWQEGLKFVPFGRDARGRWRGFQAWRAVFDELLLNRAREAGTHILQPCAALKCLFDGGRVRGVFTSQGKMQAGWVIDASGPRHWLANQLGIEIEKHSPRLVVRYGYARGECPSRDEAPAIVGDDSGWTWTAKVLPGLYQWTRLSWDGATVSRSWLPTEFERLTPAGPARRADVTWRMVAEPAGAGYFIAGDAAAVLDPASSHGVLKGIMSAMMAAHTISTIVRQQQDEGTGAGEYSRWLKDWFTTDVANLRKIYAALPSPPAWVAHQ
jgi:flavin-dependent dehydrogenase